MRKKLLILSAAAAAVILVIVLTVKIIPDKNQIKTQLSGENLQTNTTTSFEEIKTSGEKLTVTDADTFNSNPTDKTPPSDNAASAPGTGNNNQSNAKICMEKAKKIALDHVKFKENEVNFVKAKTDYEYGKMVYEIEFYAGGKEYDFEIDSETGKILDYSSENKDSTPSPDKSLQNKITLEEAKNIALNHISIKAPSEVTFKEQKTVYDDGIYIYEIEFIKNSDRTEHEFKIDAATGKILDYDYERD